MSRVGANIDDLTVGSYYHMWVGDTQLLIGASYVTEVPGPAETGAMQSEILVYNRQTGTTIQITANVTGVDWQLNPNGKDIAYREQSQVSAYGLIPTTDAVKIARFENGALVERYAGTNGCDLAWSGDGSWLAYGIANCRLAVTPSTLTFVNASTLASVVVPQSTLGNPEILVPIGWVDVNATTDRTTSGFVDTTRSLAGATMLRRVTTPMALSPRTVRPSRHLRFWGE